VAVVYLPPDVLDTENRDQVVVIHGDMHERVEPLSDPLHGQSDFQAHVDQDQRGPVVVRMQEAQLFLFVTRQRRPHTHRCTTDARPRNTMKRFISVRVSGRDLSTRVGGAVSDLAQTQDDGVEQLVVLAQVETIDPKVEAALVDLLVLGVAKQHPAIKVVALNRNTPSVEVENHH